MPSHMDLSPPCLDAIRLACEGHPDSLRRLLIRGSRLPGPKANHKFAVMVAQTLLSHGETGARVLAQLRDAPDAADGSSMEFFPIVGLIGLGLMAASSSVEHQRKQLLEALQPFAEDARNHVREAVPVALVLCLNARGAEVVEAFASWMDGYLQAHAALVSMCEPSVLQALREPEPLIARFDEAFTLVEKAPRAHERSHGYRSLMRSLATAPALAAKRFPEPITKWLSVRATTTRVPELREAILDSVASMRRAGLRQDDVEGIEAAMQTSTRAPRDPRFDVGPTRARGGKTKRTRTSR